MKQFLIRRFVFAVISIIVATFIVLILSRGSGDPLLLYANSGYGLSAEGERKIRERLGLDHNVFVQYGLWLARTLKGDMGETILDRKPVLRIVFNKLPSTIQSKAIVAITKGRDIIAQSQSGTGKTAAFCIGILQNLNLNLYKVQTIVLLPTRELAEQVYRVCLSLSQYITVFF